MNELPALSSLSLLALKKKTFITTYSVFEGLDMFTCKVELFCFIGAVFGRCSSSCHCWLMGDDCLIYFRFCNLFLPWSDCFVFPRVIVSDRDIVFPIYATYHRSSLSSILCSIEQLGRCLLMVNELVRYNVPLDTWSFWRQGLWVNWAVDVMWWISRHGVRTGRSVSHRGSHMCHSISHPDLADSKFLCQIQVPTWLPSNSSWFFC